MAKFKVEVEGAGTVLDTSSYREAVEEFDRLCQCSAGRQGAATGKSVRMLRDGALVMCSELRLLPPGEVYLRAEEPSRPAVGETILAALRKAAPMGPLATSLEPPEHERVRLEPGDWRPPGVSRKAWPFTSAGPYDGVTVMREWGDGPLGRVRKYSAYGPAPARHGLPLVVAMGEWLAEELGLPDLSGVRVLSLEGLLTVEADEPEGEKK